MRDTRKQVVDRPSAGSKQRKGTNGSQKGAAFERLIAKQLSLWVSKGASTDLFWRTAGSGARSTGRVKKGGAGIEYQAADISLAHPDGRPFADRFVVECKSYKNLELHRLCYDPKAMLVGVWWAKVRREAEQVGREPLLIVKANGYAPLMVMLTERAQLAAPGEGVVVYALGACVVALERVLQTPWEQFAPPHQPRKTQRARLLAP